MAIDVDSWVKETARRAGLEGVPPAAIAAVVVLALAAVTFAAWRYWPYRVAEGLEETAEEAQASVAKSAATPEGAVSETMPPATAVVHVVGAVRAPGVYQLPEGSRVADAIDKAGGMLPDAVAAAINLARPVADGEQIAVPDEDAVEKGTATQAPAGAAAAADGSTTGAKVDINTADAAMLDTLPGIGPSTAQKIITEREANGPFATVDDLGRVSGIGPKRLDQLRDLVSAGP